jgi:hypothetical protein
LIWFHSFWVDLQDCLAQHSRPWNYDRLFTHCHKKSQTDRFDRSTRTSGCCRLPCSRVPEEKSDVGDQRWEIRVRWV